MATQRRYLADHPSNLRQRDTLEAEAALQFFFDDTPFAELLRLAEETGACEERDLIEMGNVLFYHMSQGMACGREAGLSFPKRLPRRGEFRPTRT